MKKSWGLIRLGILVFSFLPMLPVPPSWGKELPKIAVWDLSAREVKSTYAQELTSFLVSEITKLKKYEVYSQENVRTLAGWTEERMKLGCSSTQCLTALGQMDIAKLLSGSVGKIGNRYTVSLNIFDTQKARAENAVSEVCQTEDELIELIQFSVRKLLGEEIDAPALSPQAQPASPPPYCVAAINDLKSAYVASQMYFLDHPEGKINDIDDLKRIGFQKNDKVSVHIEGMTLNSLFISTKHPQCDKIYVIDPMGTVTEKENKP